MRPAAVLSCCLKIAMLLLRVISQHCQVFVYHLILRLSALWPHVDIGHLYLVCPSKSMCMAIGTWICSLMGMVSVARRAQILAQADAQQCRGARARTSKAAPATALSCPVTMMAAVKGFHRAARTGTMCLARCTLMMTPALRTK